MGYFSLEIKKTTEKYNKKRMENDLKQSNLKVSLYVIFILKKNENFEGKRFEKIRVFFLSFTVPLNGFYEQSLLLLSSSVSTMTSLGASSTQSVCWTSVCCRHAHWGSPQGGGQGWGAWTPLNRWVGGPFSPGSAKARHSMSPDRALGLLSVLGHYRQTESFQGFSIFTILQKRCSVQSGVNE